MGRKKKNAEATAPAAETKEAAKPITNISAERDRLAQMRARLSRVSDLVRSGIESSARQVLLDELDEEIATLRNELEIVPPADLKFLQGKLKAKREDRSRIAGEAWDADLAEAERQLEEFDHANALLVEPTGEDQQAQDLTGRCIKLDLADSAATDEAVLARLRASGFVNVGGDERWYAPADSRAAIELADALNGEGIAWEVRWSEETPSFISFGDAIPAEGAGNVVDVHQEAAEG